jgi:two-component system sensor histidine kinase RegB
VTDQTALITLRGLIMARWVLIGLFSLVVVLRLFAPSTLAPSTLGSTLESWLHWFPDDPQPQAFIAVLVAWASLNLATQFWLGHGHASTSVVGIQLVLDVALLTVLLALAGGVANPFTTLYFVPITMSTQLSFRWAAAMLACTLAAFASLFAIAPSTAPVEAQWAGHVRGGWIAFAVAAGLLTLLVQRIGQSASRARDELTRMRDQRIQDQHLAALGTLAAGAAHELGTPLGTVNLLAAELPHMAPEEQSAAIDTIKREVARCKDILHRMASPEVRVSALSARDAQPWRLCDLVEELDDPDGVTLTIETTDATKDERGTTTLASASLGQIMRELVANAAEACRRKPGNKGIRLKIDVAGEDASILVEDDGVGMTAEVAAAVFEPFFTTKAEGEGMGLGLYLARAQLLQLGGTLELESHPGRGTRVRIRVGLRPPDPFLDR